MLHNTILYLLSALLTISSLLKAVNIYSFSSETQLYIDAYMPSIFVTFYVEASIIVCFIELMAALFITSKKLRLHGEVLSFFLLSFFLYLTAINFFKPSEYGSIETCGCFGELVHFSPKASLTKTFFLWFLSSLLIINSIRKKEYKNIFQNKKITKIF